MSFSEPIVVLEQLESFAEVEFPGVQELLESLIVLWEIVFQFEIVTAPDEASEVLHCQSSVFGVAESDIGFLNETVLPVVVEVFRHVDDSRSKVNEIFTIEQNKS